MKVYTTFTIFTIFNDDVKFLYSKYMFNLNDFIYNEIVF